MNKETITKWMIQNCPCPMWNRTLSAEEIEWLYKNSKPAHEVWWFEENWELVFYWPDGRRY